MLDLSDASYRSSTGQRSCIMHTLTQEAVTSGLRGLDNDALPEIDARCLTGHGPHLDAVLNAGLRAICMSYCLVLAKGSVAGLGEVCATISSNAKSRAVSSDTIRKTDISRENWQWQQI